MTNTNQQEQLYSRQDVINAWNSAYGGDRYLSGEQYVDDLLPTPPVEDGKQGGEVEHLLKAIEELQFKTIPINKYDENKTHSVLREKWIKQADVLDIITKSQPSTPVQDGWNEEQIIEAANQSGLHSIQLLIKKLHDSK